MTSVLDKLNLSPQERRLVVGVGFVVFLVLNVWLVWPYFGRLGEVRQRTRDANVQLGKYRAEIVKKAAYEQQRKELETQGNYIPTEEQALALQREITQMSALSGVHVQNIVPLGRQTGGRTNTFFEDQTVQLNIQNTGEKELVDFLLTLGSQNTLIRVRNMNIRPELPGRMKLGGQITLAKSFQRKPPKAAPAPAAATTARPAPPAQAKPAEAKKPEPTPAAATPPKLQRNVPTLIGKTNAAGKPAVPVPQ